jgi:hypothetical protein
MIKKHQRNITGFIRKVYYAYFGVKLGDQDKSRAPHNVCYICVEDLRKWSKGKKKAFRFGVPMIWREPKNHNDFCYFCCCKVRVLCMLLGQQAGYTRFPCFMCEWDSRTRSQHWEQKHWTPRTSLELGSKNILRISLVDPKKILLPPLRIKLGIMKQFVKSFAKN